MVSQDCFKVQLVRVHLNIEALCTLEHTKDLRMKHASQGSRLLFSFDQHKVVLHLCLNQPTVTSNCAPHYCPSEALLMTKIYLRLEENSSPL